MTEKKTVTAVKAEPSYNRNAILRSVKWSRYIDLLEPFLIDGTWYTEADVNKILKERFNIKRSD